MKTQNYVTRQSHDVPTRSFVPTQGIRVDTFCHRMRRIRTGPVRPPVVRPTAEPGSAVTGASGVHAGGRREQPARPSAGVAGGRHTGAVLTIADVRVIDRDMAPAQLPLDRSS